MFNTNYTNNEILKEIEDYFIDSGEEVIHKEAIEDLKYELTRGFFGQAETMYAVILDHPVRWGISGGIVGIYTDEQVAHEIRDSLARVANDEEDDLDWRPDYSVRALEINGNPMHDEYGVGCILGWCYIE